MSERRTLSGLALSPLFRGFASGINLADAKDPQQRRHGQNAQKRFPIGESWDLFPYPNSRSGFPGITAWLTNDGKAEIIVRLLK